MYDFPKYKDMQFWFFPAANSKDYIAVQKESMNDIARVSVKQGELFDVHYISGISLTSEMGDVLQHDFLLYQYSCM